MAFFLMRLKIFNQIGKIFSWDNIPTINRYTYILQIDKYYRNEDVSSRYILCLQNNYFVIIR
jgi:hypothetical protein